MTLWMPNKKKPLYAPMLATFGGGSVRGFKGSGGAASGPGSAISTLDILGDGSCVSCINMDTMADLNSSNTFAYSTQHGGQVSSVAKWGTYAFYIPDNSSQDWVTTSALDLSGGNGSYTLSAWFRLAGHRASGIQPVLMMVSGTSVDSEGAITVAGISGNTSVRNYGKGRSNATTLDTGYDTGIPISVDTWYQGVHVYDSVANTYKMYLNGSSVNLALTVTSASSTGNQPVGLTDSSNVDILLGHEPDTFHPFGGFSGSQNIIGYIDQVRIFDKALSLTEINQVHQESL